MVSLKVEVDLKGPLFKKAPALLKEAVGGAVRELTEAGEGRLLQTLIPRPAGVYLSVQEAGLGKESRGHYRKNISTTQTGLNALITDGGVVYGPWLEGTSSRNAVTRFKGYASFRRVGQWINEQRSKVLARHMNHAVRKLNG